MPSWFKRIAHRLLGFLTFSRLLILIVVGGFFWFFILGDQGVYQLRQLSLMKTNLLHEHEELEAEKKRLLEERHFLEEPKNLEMIIRQELGAIKEGEVIFEGKQKKSNNEDKKTERP